MTSPVTQDGAAQRGGFTHQALLYASPEEFLAGAVPFINQGLQADEHLLVVLDTAKVELLRDHLDGTAEQVEFVDATRVYTYPAWTLTGYEWSVRTWTGAGRRMRVVGELIWSDRTPLEISEWTRMESLCNVVFAEAALDMLCPYDVRALDPAIIADARRTHPAIMVRADGRPSPDYMEPTVFGAERDRDPLPPLSAPTEALAFRIGDLHTVRRAVFNYARRAGLAEHRAADLTLAVNEASTNTLQHGGGHGTVRLWTTPSELVCEITDAGGRISHPFPGLLPPPLDSERGRGLWLARQLCELVEVRSDATGSTVRLHLLLNEHRNRQLGSRR